MKLRYKLILSMLFVAAAPVGIAGFQAMEQSRLAVEERIREILAKTSRAEAEIIGRDIDEVARSLRFMVDAMDVDTQSLSNLSDNLTRVYLLSDRFNAVALFDAEGSQLGPTIFVDDRASFGPEYQSHEEVNADELKTFLQETGRGFAKKEPPLRGDIHISARKQVPLTIFCLPLAATDENQQLFLAVELSLDNLQKRFEQISVGRTGFAFLVDSHGRLVFHPDRKRALAREDASGLGLLQGRLGTSNASVAEYADPLVGDMVGAFAPVPGSQWAVVVTQPKEEALGPVRVLGIRLLSWLLIGLAVAGLVGLFLAGRITLPIHALVQGAMAIAGGKLEHKIRVSGRDEIGRLGSAFSHMGNELQKHRAQIEAQTEEIKRWNIELQRRVDERTRELNEAHDQLMHAQKMAAVGELGSGVAHEINNPLMGVLGCAQLLLMRHPEGDPDNQMLADIERESQRIRVIVSKLLDVSQTGRRGMARVNLGSLVSHIFALRTDELQRSGVLVELDIQPDLPPVLGSAAQLEQALAELVENARRAMPEGGKLRVTASGREGELIKLEVRDEGVGIPAEHQDRIFEPFYTTKQAWDGQGLGLSMVFHTIQQHNGKIAVHSATGQGTAFVLTFPALRRETHLR